MAAEPRPHQRHTAAAHRFRSIEVLVDRDAVTSGAAANGEPWQYFDPSCA
ncbi:hypothetical protein [Streptomyces sp. NPDC056672]